MPIAFQSTRREPRNESGACRDNPSVVPIDHGGSIVKRLVLALLLPAALLFAASSASAGDGVVGAAYSITNSAAGNALVVFTRSADGSLSPAGAVPTGGLGTGAGLASQGAVTLTRDGHTILAVNPGSNSVSAFRVEKDGPELLNVAPSGGIRPVSVDVHHDLVYVLNKNNAALATVSGFALTKEGLTPIAGSTRFLNAGATDAAQVRFSPDGDVLVVTGRSSNRIDTFLVGKDGLLSHPKTFDPAPGGTPFGFDFDKRGNVLVSLAGVAPSSGAASYELAEDGTLTTITAPISTGQNAACWLVTSKDGRFAFVANAASASVSTFSVSPKGELAFLGATTIPGMTPLDLDISKDGKYVYVLAAGSHGIVEFDVDDDGSLTFIGAMPSIPATAAGIAVR
jgi:6-phosphogluconolactonase